MKFSFCCVGPVPLTPSPPVGVPAAPRRDPTPGTRGASPAAGADTGHPAGSRFCLCPRATVTRQAGFPCLTLAGDETLRGIRVRSGPGPRGELSPGSRRWVPPPCHQRARGCLGRTLMCRIGSAPLRSPASQIQLRKAFPALLAFD